jgi:hypothetical protein
MTTATAMTTTSPSNTNNTSNNANNNANNNNNANDVCSPDVSSALDELMLFLEPSKNRNNRSDVKFEAVKAVSKGMADR